jgi:signal transduction histidine kinase
LLSLLLFVLGEGFAGTLSPVSADTGEVHRVLVVFENESTQAAAVQIANGLHAELDAERPTRFEIYSEYLDHARFPDPGNEQRIAADLAAKYSGVTIEVVVTVGPYALKFMATRSNQIAPHAPIVSGAVTRNAIEDAALTADVKGVASEYDIVKTLQFARKLQPEATKVVVVTGNGDFDKRWEMKARGTLEKDSAGFSPRFLSGLSLEGFSDAVGRLPPDTIVLVLSVFMDAKGRKYVPADAAGIIARAASVPSYSVYDTFVGQGIVGGYMDTFQGVGRDLARLTERVIAGDRDIPRATSSTAHPIVDWREIERWKIPEGRLPADTVRRFYAPSIFEQYGYQILVVIAVVLAQAGLISALVVQDRLRRRAENEARLQRAELAHISRAAMLGELSGAFAHELNQPLASILANAQAGARMLQVSSLDIEEIRNILSDIVAEDKRAVAVIAQLRKMMVKGETTLEPLDLNDVVGSTLKLVNSELMARRIDVDFARRSQTAPAIGNFIQLQQIILNLILNAAEAMSQQPPGSRKIRISTAVEEGFLKVSVQDTGPGISSEMKEKAFQPFVSSKSNGLGLGLPICRSIAIAHMGSLDFADSKKSGARVVLSIPTSGGGP